MDILGDHLSYVTLVIFGLFAVGVHAYASFGQQVPGGNTNQSHVVLDSLSVVSLGGQYSVFRGFVFYLLISESLYVLLASSSMILQLTLNAMGREEMAGALSSGIELNPLIPVLASSIIISASQIRPLSQVEHSIRRIGHRIAGIPRNVHEIQERIKATSLESLSSQTSIDSSSPTQSLDESRNLNHAAQYARQRADEVVSSPGVLELRVEEQQLFRESMHNLLLLHELSRRSSVSGASAIPEYTQAQRVTAEFITRLDVLVLQTESGVSPQPLEFKKRWAAVRAQCQNAESQLIGGICTLLLEPEQRARVNPSLARIPDSVTEKVSDIFRRLELISTQPYSRDGLLQMLNNIYVLRTTLENLTIARCKYYGEHIARATRNLYIKGVEFEDSIIAMVENRVSGADTDKALAEDEGDWDMFIGICQSYERDLVSTLSLFLADKSLSMQTRLLHDSSRIASYARNKATLFADAGASLDFSAFRVEGFQTSLEKVFCLYEWTLGADGARIWATQDTQQITLLFESIKHKFDAFEADLSSLILELDENSPERNVASVKGRWKEAVNRCSLLEDDLTLLLSLLLINKPDAQLGNYPLLSKLRNHVLERDRNHEMNAFGMSALLGFFLSLFLLCTVFEVLDGVKQDLRSPSAYQQSTLGPVHKNYQVQDEQSLVIQVFTQLVTEGGVRELQRVESQEFILDFIRSIADSFFKACLEVLDYLIIFSVSAGIALAIRAMRKVERRWPNRTDVEPPPMYSYLFVGMVAYLVSASFILLYRFVRIVLMPMINTQTNLLSSAHLTLFRDSFAEYLLFPVTAFVVVWFVLEHVDRRESRGLIGSIWMALKFAVLCALINIVGKVFTGSFNTGWDIANFLVLPTAGFLSFLLMFMYYMKRYQVKMGMAKDTHSPGGIGVFLEMRDFQSSGAIDVSSLLRDKPRKVAKAKHSVTVESYS